MGVQRTRPNIDIGLTVLTRAEGKYRLMSHRPAEFAREVFHELELDAGDYYIVPKSLGLAVCAHDVDEPGSQTYDIRSPELLSIARDVFEKHDINTAGVLRYPELKAFHDFVGVDFNESEYQELLLKHERQNAEMTAFDGITQNDFICIFDRLIKSRTPSAFEDVLLKLGYTRNLFSYRTRVCRLTLHSDTAVKVNVLDALADDVDRVVDKLLIRRHGQRMHCGNQDQLASSDIHVRYYHNK